MIFREYNSSMHSYFIQAKANVQGLLGLNKRQKPFNSKLTFDIGSFYFLFLLLQIVY